MGEVCGMKYVQLFKLNVIQNTVEMGKNKENLYLAPSSERIVCGSRVVWAHRLTDTQTRAEQDKMASYISFARVNEKYRFQSISRGSRELPEGMSIVVLVLLLPSLESLTVCLLWTRQLLADAFMVMKRYTLLQTSELL